MSKQIKRIRHSHAHTTTTASSLLAQHVHLELPNSPHLPLNTTTKRTQHGHCNFVGTVREQEWARWRDKVHAQWSRNKTFCTKSVVGVSRASVDRILLLFLLSFLCIFLLFLLHLVGNNHRQRQSTVASQREWVGVKFGGILHRLVTSAFSASRMHQRPTGKMLLPPLSAPVPASPPPTTTAVTSLHDWFSYYKLLLLFMTYMYISIELLFKGFSCITSNLLGFYNFFVAFFKRF